MDFWDLVKLMWRRWYVTVPMLLVTALAAGWIVVTVGPEYQATGYVTVVPPAVQRQPESGQTTQVNPWNEEALADAASIRLQGKTLRDEMAAAGYEAKWSVEITGRLPVINMEVVAPTAEQAIDTMHALQEVVEQEVAERQSEYNVSDGEHFTTVRYDQGESVETTASRLRRTLVAVVAAGLIFTVAAVAAFDAVARWRRSRRGSQPQTSFRLPTLPLAAAAEPASDDGPRRRYAFGGSGRAAPANGSAAVPSGNGDRPIPQPTEPTSPAPVSVSGSASVGSASVGSASGSASVGSASGSASVGSASVGESPLPVPDDSTVVLPLSNVPWAGRGKNGGRGANRDRDDRSTEASTP
jgi:capsular polysaccharide biosynthesis protein